MKTRVSRLKDAPVIAARSADPRARAPAARVPGASLDLTAIPRTAGTGVRPLALAWLRAAAQSGGLERAADPGVLTEAAIYVLEEIEQGRGPDEPPSAETAGTVAAVAQRIVDDADAVELQITEGTATVDGTIVRPTPPHVIAASLGLAPVDATYLPRPRPALGDVR